MSHKGVGFEVDEWKEAAKIYRTMMGLELEQKSGRASEEVKAMKGTVAAAKGQLWSMRDLRT